MVEIKRKSLATVFDSLYEGLKDRGKQPSPPYPIGLDGLDDLLWGLHRSDLVVVAALPGNGKSSLVGHIAWNLVTKNKPCLLMSLEMTMENVLGRMWCAEEKIHNGVLRKGLDDQHEKQYISFRNKLLQYPLQIYDRYGFRINEIEKVAMEDKPEVMIVDHVQMISAKGYPNKYEALSSFVRSSKELAVKYNIATILCSQFNRGAAGTKGALHLLKGSGELEEAADVVISCEWKYKEWNGKGISPDPTEYWLTVLKNRHGPCGKVKVCFRAQHFRFENWTVPSIGTI